MNKAKNQYPILQVTSIEEILDAEIVEARCNEGWVYHMLDRITDFSPKFLYAYVHGGLLLSVLVDDREGARQIFEKGLKSVSGSLQFELSRSISLFSRNEESQEELLN